MWKTNKRSGIQLCYPFEVKRLNKWTSPYIVQPKLDGERCRAVHDGATWKLYSSEQNEILSVPHIVDELNSFGEKIPRVELDGELYTHGLQFEDIHSRVGRTVNLHPEFYQIHYNIFDIVSDEPQIERLLQLQQMKSILTSGEYLEIVPCDYADNIEEVMSSYNGFLKDGYEGYMNNRVITIPEILRKHDYHTYMSGKWHLGAFDTNYYPSGRGFERSFAMMGGGSGFYQNAFPLAPMEKDVTFYVRDKNKVEELPDDFYSTKAFTDEMIKYIKEQKDDKPFFSYLAYTAPHDPLHAPAEYIEKYKGVYDNGYSAIKTKRLTQMKSKGLINKSMPSNPGTGKFPDWESLSEKEQKSQARKMEIYAAMIDYMDNQIGRVIDALKEENKYDNTIFIVMSDNGANPKEAIFYFLGDQELFSSQGFDNSFENMGKTNSFVSQGGAWAEVSETPFTYFKTTTGEGGIRAPLIISGAGIETTGIHNATMHVTDILPTILSFAKVKRPKTYKNKELKPLYGQSAASFLKGESSIIRDTESKPISWAATPAHSICEHILSSSPCITLRY